MTMPASVFLPKTILAWAVGSLEVVVETTRGIPCPAVLVVLVDVDRTAEVAAAADASPSPPPMPRGSWLSSCEGWTVERLAASSTPKKVSGITEIRDDDDVVVADFKDDEEAAENGAEVVVVPAAAAEFRLMASVPAPPAM